MLAYKNSVLVGHTQAFAGIPTEQLLLHLAKCVAAPAMHALRLVACTITISSSSSGNRCSVLFFCFKWTRSKSSGRIAAATSSRILWGRRQNPPSQPLLPVHLLLLLLLLLSRR